jgi:hypothetical protein
LSTFSDTRSQAELQLIESTLTEVLNYSNTPDDCEVKCIATLLEHFVAASIADLVVAFLNQDSQVPQLVAARHKRGNPTKKAVRRIVDALSSSPALVLSDMRAGGTQIRELTLPELGEAAAEALGAFRSVVIAVAPAFPPAVHAQESLTFVFLSRSATPRLEFLLQWLGIIIPTWANAFRARLLAFESRLELLSKATGMGDLMSSEAKATFSGACRAQSWLNSETVSRLCEMLVGWAEEAEGKTPQARADTRDIIKEFGRAWHACPDRSWPCDEGAGVELALPMLFEWRLADDADEEADILKEALASARAQLLAVFARFADPARLDTILCRFFMLQLVDALCIGSYVLPHRSTEGYEVAKKHLCRFMSVALSGQSHYPESIEAMAWVIAQYSYQVLKIDPRLHLASHLAHGARGEPSLHMMREFYRDHFFHTIEVCFLGHLLAHARSTEGKGLFILTPSMLRQWYVTALLHDIGYAVDVSASLKEWLDFFVSSTFEALADGIEAALVSMGDLDSFSGFVDRLGLGAVRSPHRDHGVVGARHLEALTDEARQQGNLHQVARAVEAIAKHNSHDVHVRFTASSPLTALLILCDTLQAWRRPQFPHFSKAPAWMMAAMIAGRGSDALPTPQGASLTSSLRIAEVRGQLSVTYEDPLVLRLEFGPEVNRDSFVFNIWLDAVRNLQRVDFSELPSDVLVQLVTPAYSQQGAVFRRHMDRLRDAASETHMAYLEPFLNATTQGVEGLRNVRDKRFWKRTAVRPISYFYEDAREDRAMPREMLSLSIRRLAGKSPFVRESLKRFRKDLRGWKHYHDDRLTLGDYSPWRHKQPGE